MNSAFTFRSVVMLMKAVAGAACGMRTRPLLAALAAASSFAAHSAQVQVAVAANFSAPIKALAADFEQRSGHTLSASYGSTGKFYAQIRNGAPFDVLLAADEATPARLVAEDAALGASRFTYAIGRLALWSAQPALVDDRGDVLKRGDFRRLALASPRLAPYGTAAIETLAHLGLLEALRPKFVQGESVGQAFGFVASGNAELGFVALSQVLRDDGSGQLRNGSVWRVPAALHAPIRQDAVLLQHGRDNPAAQALLDYLKSDAARAVMRGFGYGI